MNRPMHAGRLKATGLGLTMFSEADFDDVHHATLEVLEQTGVFVEDDEPLAIYADGGCDVDRDTHVVRIPPQVVEAALRRCPPRVRFCGRDPRRDLVLEGDRVAFMNFSEGLRYVDPWTGEHRAATLADVADVARLVDALPDIDRYASAIGAGDVPEPTYALHGLAAALASTTKPVGCEATDKWSVRLCVELAALVVGGHDELRARPIVAHGVCPVSPLKLPRDATEVIIECARLGIPDTILSMAMAGGSAPVTLAGTLVVHNAEVLSGITLAQLTEPGAPVVYGSSTTAMDLRLATAAVGSPELALIGAAVAFLARRYKLPSFIAGA